MTDFISNDKSSFAIGMRAVVSGLFSGALSRTSANFQASKLIESELRDAFHAGFVRAGIFPSELTPTEENKINSYIATQLDFLPGFLNDIIDSNNRSAMFSRVNLWVNRINQANTLGFTWADNNPKVKWVIGPTEESCSSCSKLDKKVKRKSQFEENGTLPQGENLECQGYNCLCELEEVGSNEPMSMGPLPNP